MCAGGPGEAWVGDPEVMAMTEWARANRRRGGVVIRPHFPGCGFSEDPVTIIKGLVDAVEISLQWSRFPVQEWYRFLNCGYRVAVCGGTDKMSAGVPVGWTRTYARLDPKRPFTYEAWAKAVRAGRTVTSTGPLLNLTVDGHAIGDTIRMRAGGGTVEVEADVQSFWPVGTLEVVHNGRVVASEGAAAGARSLRVKGRLNIGQSGWIAARCWGPAGAPSQDNAAHTSPVYVTCGRTRLFEGPAAQHMLSLVEGTMEYMRHIATIHDEATLKRMLRLYREVRHELKHRLKTEAGPRLHHHGDGVWHGH